MASMAKDLHRLIRRVGKLTDGQASFCDLEWEDGDIDSFRVEIRPNSGFYQGGIFRFRVYIPSEYDSDEPPKVHCETDIYHPNIDTTGAMNAPDASNVCLDLLDRGTWNPKMGLEGVIIGLVFLMHNPNLADPLFDEFHDFFYEDFEDNVKRYMRGEDVDGREFSADFLCNIQSKTIGGCGVDGTECKLVADITGTEKSKETLSITDNDARTLEKQCEDHHSENMQTIETNQPNANSESGNGENETHNGADGNIQKYLLELLGFTEEEKDSNDNYEGNTTITFDEETVLVPYDAAELLREEIGKNTTENESNSEQPTEEQDASAHIIAEQTEIRTFTCTNAWFMISNTTENESNSEEQAASTQIIAEQTEIRTFTCTNAWFMIDKTNYEEHNACRINTAGRTLTLNEYRFALHKSPESIASKARAFSFCAPYLKCILFHTNSFTWDLTVSGRSFKGNMQRIGSVTDPLRRLKNWIIFKVHLPTDNDGSSTAVCDSHPYIITTILLHATTNDNVSLSILEKGTGSHTCGPEGVVIGLVYLLGNQQLTLYFDCDKQVQKLFKENVNNYLRIGDVERQTFCNENDDTYWT